MHQIEIAPHALARAMSRRGRVRIHDSLDPARTALIVVDMQNAFVAPGFALEIPMAREIVPNINKLAAAVRLTGGKVIWIRNTIQPETAENWSAWVDDFMTPAFAEKVFAQMGRGSEGHQLWPLLDVAPEDAQIEKTRFSALIQGSSDLEAHLRARGIDTLIITGTATQVCCESTARDAMMLNFTTVFIADGNAAATDADHNAALSSLVQIFCDVQTTDEAIACLESGARAKLAAE